MNEYANRVHTLVKDAPINNKQQEFIIELIDDLAKTNDSEQLLQMYGSPENFIEQHSGEVKQEDSTAKTTPVKRTTNNNVEKNNNNAPRNKGLCKIIKILYFVFLRIPFMIIRVIATIFILWSTFTIATSPLTSIATIISAIVLVLATLSFFISLNAVMTKTYRMIINYIRFNKFKFHSLYSIVIWIALSIISFMIFNVSVHGFISSISLSALTDRFEHIANFITNFIN